MSRVIPYAPGNQACISPASRKEKDRMKYGFLGACLLGAAMLVGCGAQPGTTTLTYDSLKSTPPPLTTASDKARYALYPSDGTTPKFSIDLNPGDQYGFTKDSDGKVVAIANGEKITLDAWVATSWYWKEQK
jgi:hypothetical protein